ncbi:tRNA 2-thiouridine(34) synthase MnmA [Perlucidibaca piscinae]|uniref:tRNA 2-thiouridine(34) synthase MnmA n=1 Tax=Perlucidibaca piscinae TaxID=392589 RepID=UPI00040B5791|nr:tRNA 2-thiouridine(34) synthase MnmA [Perlucidibaca piscinae]
MTELSRRKVIVGMSGGVDSSVSAWLLLQQGYHVEGLFMKNWEEDDGTEYCTARQDLADAQAVCDRLGIHLHQANFAAEYWDRVFEHFLHEYQAGRTPNPDILCNKEIKFRAFLDYALALGADCIATGHYARRGSGDPATLLRGLDANKDQSYFLHAVSGREIARTLFPVGELEKPEVRRIASEQGLATAAKKDSTGICFIGERRFRDFLKQYLPAQPGDIEKDDGSVIGRHEGLMYYTLGQRQGIGIGGRRDAEESAWYVVGKDLSRNVLIVGQGHGHPMMMSRSLRSSRVDWVAGHPPAVSFRCTAKTRYRQQDQACRVEMDGEHALVVFDEAQRAVTPGQSVVFYDGDVCLGGGVIEETGSQ